MRSAAETAAGWHDAMNIVCLVGPPLLEFVGVGAGTLRVLIQWARGTRRPLEGLTRRDVPLYVGQWVVLLVGYGVFLWSLIEPAPGGGPGSTSILGIYALLFAFPFWLLNGWLVVAPLIVMRLQILRDRRMQGVVFVAQVTSALAVAHLAPQSPDPTVSFAGEVLWKLAFWIIAVAYAVPTGRWFSGRRGKAAGEGAVVPVEEKSVGGYDPPKL